MVSALDFRPGGWWSSALSSFGFLFNCFCCLGGDGPKRALLEDVCEQCNLQDRVTFLGKLEHEKVRDVSLTGSSIVSITDVLRVHRTRNPFLPHECLFNIQPIYVTFTNYRLLTGLVVYSESAKCGFLECIE